MPARPGLSDNTIAAIAYFTPVIPLFFLAVRRYNKRPYVRFHAWQSLLFNVFAFAFGCILVYVLPFFAFFGSRVLAGLVCIAFLVAIAIWLLCVIKAANGKRFKLPIIGDWSDEQAYR